MVLNIIVVRKWKYIKYIIVAKKNSKRLKAKTFRNFEIHNIITLHIQILMVRWYINNNINMKQNNKKIHMFWND